MTPTKIGTVKALIITLSTKLTYGLAIIPAKIDSTNAEINMAAMILDQEKALIEEMNSLGSSPADNKRYDELKLQRTKIYKSAIPYLESVMKVDPDNIDAAKTLMNIYSATGDTEKYKAMKAKVDALIGN